MKFKKIYIEITNKCNLNCSFCNNNKRDKKFMSIEDFERVIKEIKSYTNYVYLHVKGEPLLHPDIDRILSICDDNKITCVFRDEEDNNYNEGAIIFQSREVGSEVKIGTKLTVTIATNTKEVPSDEVEGN